MITMMMMVMIVIITLIIKTSVYYPRKMAYLQSMAIVLKPKLHLDWRQPQLQAEIGLHLLV